MAKMLTGLPCASAAAPDAAAAAAAVSRLAFVGLVERWRDSVCLFHRTIGARVAGGSPGAARAGARGAGPPARLPPRPREGQLLNIHAGLARAGAAADGDAWRYDEAVLDGFVDEADEAVYAAARARFEADLRRYGGCRADGGGGGL